MGRPLPKRFFGNENTGSASTTADDGIGGQGLLSVGVNNVGSYTTRPTLSIGAPDLPTGVQAVGTVTSEALSATVSAGGSGFAVGDLLNVTTAGGSAIAYVASVDAGNSDAILTVNFTGTGASRGSFEALGAVTTTVNTSTSGTGTLTLVVTWRAKSVTVTESGSGYTAAPTVTSGGSVTYNAITLTSPSGVPYSAQAFATIRCTAQTTSGGSPLAGDIISQRGSRRYRVITTDGTEVCSLVAATPAAAGEMSIIATDYSGNTYYVTKLTRHRVLLTQNTGASHEFSTGSSAAWTLDSLVAGDTGVTVQLANK